MTLFASNKACMSTAERHTNCTTNYPAWLRRVLWIDGTTGLLASAIQLTAPQLLGRMYGLPEALIQSTAFILLIFVALIALLLARPQVPNGGLKTLVVGNTLWMVASLGLVLTQHHMLTTLGVAYVSLQTAFVGVLTYLEAKAMK